MIMVFSVFLGTSLPAMAANASNQTITAKMDFKNEFKDDLISIKLAVSGTEKWGKELLTKPLKPGETINIPITIESGKTKFDIKLTSNDAKAANQKYSSRSHHFEGMDLNEIKANTGGIILFRYAAMNSGFYTVVYSYADYPQISQIDGKPASTILFNVKNETKNEMETLKLSPSGKDKWGENLLKEPLKAGASAVIPIAVTSELTKWDIYGTGLMLPFGFKCKGADFSRLTPETGGNLAIRFSTINYNIETVVSNDLPKTPYPKQSGNNIELFDTDSDGVLSADEVQEQVTAAKPNYKIGFEVRLSEKIHTIGKNAFERHQLSKITIPNTVTTIESDAFAYAGKLKTVIFKEGLVTIEPRAFLKTGLTSVTLPNSLKIINDQVFNGCDQLSNVTLGEGVTSLGMGAFGRTIITDLKLPESLTTIGYGAFSNCTKLKTINLSNGVKRIEKQAFTTCTALKEINLGQITYLGDSAFLQCTNLEKIQLPETLDSIGYNPFEYCVKLVEINTDPNSKFFTSVDGVLYAKDLSTLYAYPNARVDKTLVLPSKVTIIKAGAFSNTHIKSVTLPAGLKSIENNSFGTCESLQGIQLPAGLENIGSLAFDNCKVLRGEIVIPESLKSFGGNAFRRTAISKVTINSNIDLSPAMFIECKYLESVSINGKVAKIGRGAFRSCSKLSNITLPKTLKVLESASFNGCSSLTSIKLPEGLTAIGEGDKVLDEIDMESRGGVFAGCTRLKSIVMPNSVVYLEGEAFDGCKSLKSVTLSKNPKFTTIKSRTFSRTTSLGEIIIPKNVIKLEEFVFIDSGIKKITMEPNSRRVIETGGFDGSSLEGRVIK